MIRTNIWRPDTCGCVLEYEWDDAIPQDQRVHTVKSLIRSCDAHRPLTRRQTWDAVLAENTTKNKVEDLVLQNIPELVDEVLDEDDRPVKNVKRRNRYSFDLDVDRKVRARFRLMTGAQKVLLQTLADQTIGPGKVVVE